MTACRWKRKTCRPSTPLGHASTHFQQAWHFLPVARMNLVAMTCFMGLLRAIRAAPASRFVDS
jgi:hypothetical protein